MILRNFIVFEGIDGSGTTTQMSMLKKYFQENGKANKVLFTQEPTDNAIGKLIRRALNGEEVFTAETMARLFAADRCEHLYGTEGIVSAVKAGKRVFSDRYLFSGIAYQTIAGAETEAKRQNENFLLPEFLFFFNISAKKAMQRVAARKGSAEIYEKIHFQERVAKEYVKVIEFYKQKEKKIKVIEIDGEKSILEIQNLILCNLGETP